MVANHGLALARHLWVHVGDDHRAGKPQNRPAHYLRWHLRRAGNRIVGHTNESLALLHRRTSAVVDHPRLAHRITLDRPHHTRNSFSYHKGHKGHEGFKKEFLCVLRVLCVKF